MGRLQKFLAKSNRSFSATALRTVASHLRMEVEVHLVGEENRLYVRRSCRQPTNLVDSSLPLSLGPGIPNSNQTRFGLPMARRAMPVQLAHHLVKLLYPRERSAPSSLPTRGIREFNVMHDGRQFARASVCGEVQNRKLPGGVVSDLCS